MCIGGIEGDACITECGVSTCLGDECCLNDCDVFKSLNTIRKRLTKCLHAVHGPLQQSLPHWAPAKCFALAPRLERHPALVCKRKMQMYTLSQEIVLELRRYNPSRRARLSIDRRAANAKRSSSDLLRVRNKRLCIACVDHCKKHTNTSLKSLLQRNKQTHLSPDETPHLIARV